MGKRRTTLRDIAEKANVSVSTVSLVLNDKAREGNVRISDQTIRHVQRIAAESGYLFKGIIGLIVPQIDSYFSPMITAIMEVLRERKYSLAMGLQTGWDLQQEIEEVRAMENKGFDGLILSATPRLVAQFDRSPDFFQNGTRVVLTNWVSHFGTAYATVNHKRCGYLAAKHLLELGHRRIAFVGAHYPSEDDATDTLTDTLIDTAIVDARFQGYLEAMKEYDQPYVSVERAEDVLGLPGKVTAAYCGRALWAADLLGACFDKGVRVPDDLSIVGQDDNRGRTAARPRLTAVHVREREIGRRAAEMVLATIDGEKPESVILEPELVVRESTRPL